MGAVLPQAETETNGLCDHVVPRLQANTALPVWSRPTNTQLWCSPSSYSRPKSRKPRMTWEAMPLFLMWANTLRLSWCGGGRAKGTGSLGRSTEAGFGLTDSVGESLALPW